MNEIPLEIAQEALEESHQLGFIEQLGGAKRISLHETESSVYIVSLVENESPRYFYTSELSAPPVNFLQNLLIDHCTRCKDDEKELERYRWKIEPLTPAKNENFGEYRIILKRQDDSIDWLRVQNQPVCFKNLEDAGSMAIRLTSLSNEFGTGVETIVV